MSSAPSIFKSPVAGPTACRRLNLDGDLQSDLAVHGGPDKAVYAYHAEHYAFWREELPGVQLPWGSFGENLTIDGLPDESELYIGDRLRVGSAVLAITQPRLPCAKLALRFRRPDMVKRFLASGRTGFYLAVVSEGIVEAGDEVEIRRPRQRRRQRRRDHTAVCARTGRPPCHAPCGRGGSAPRRVAELVPQASLRR